MPYTQIDSQVVYQGRAFDVRRARVRLPDGREQHLDIVEHVPAVTLVPVDAEGNLWFIRQYRHAAVDTILELPAGTIEAGEDPQVCALRELREEIGFTAGKIEQIGTFFLAPGYSTEFMYVYLAQELHPDPLPGDDDEIIQPVPVPARAAYELAQRGELGDAKSLAALFLARPHLADWLGITD